MINNICISYCKWHQNMVGICCWIFVSSFFTIDWIYFDILIDYSFIFTRHFLYFTLYVSFWNDIWLWIFHINNSQRRWKITRKSISINTKNNILNFSVLKNIFNLFWKYTSIVFFFFSFWSILYQWKCKHETLE